MIGLFDYSGMSASELEVLCDDKNGFGGYVKWKFWTSESQSSGKYLRIYGYYPRFLPLYVNIEHGVEMSSLEADECVAVTDLENEAYCHFYMDARYISHYKKKSRKPCLPMKSLAAYCRERNDYTQDINAKGTLFFFAHSLDSTENKMSLKDLFCELHSLPEEMKPVCICLYVTDIKKGVHKSFIEAGFPVYSAGNGCDINFYDRWYRLVKHFKYTSSNMIGSYTFYSVEMGIPFFLYGSEPLYYNYSDPNMPIGFYNGLKERWYRDIADMFTYKNFDITLSEKQVAFTKMKLGLETGVSRKTMSKILWEAYFSKENILLFIIRAVLFLPLFPIKEFFRLALYLKLYRVERKF